MTAYRKENLDLAAREIGRISHQEALRKYIPEILDPYGDNGFSVSGKTPLRAAVFNFEQGTYIKQIVSYFAYHPLLREVDIVFANELDCGMARTGNLNITREFAASLGMNYVYGVEFVTTRAGEDGNREGLHGNALFSRFPLERTKVVHLPIEYDWFYRENDSRLGTRIAVLAEIRAGDMGPVGLVCVHLENRATPQGRKRQLEYLLDEIEAHFGKDLPVLIGGDMNTNTVDGNGDNQMFYLADHPGEQWRRLGQIPSWEPQMDYAASRGFRYDDCNIMEKTTRRKPMSDGRTVLLNLDWFYQRGLDCRNPVKVESIFHTNGLGDVPGDIRAYQGQEMSDHDMVLVACGRKG
ncbi:MAG: endonuclease/exonuclease/phosphatase family protein [Treponema sp.]|nr:endonuclease/exonuclease/phosphatase family protein [Treponema sp.]